MMENEELKELYKKLIDCYHKSRMVCPPDEYLFRQRNLLYNIAEVLIKMLHKEEYDE